MPACIVIACWCGDIAEGEHVLAPLRALRPAGRRHDPADALPGDAADARRRLPRRHPQLLAGELRARPDRRGDRHHRRAWQPHGARRSRRRWSSTTAAPPARVDPRQRRLRPARRRLQHRHDRAMDRPGRDRAAHRLDARLLRGDRALRARQPPPELPERGERRRGPRRVRRRTIARLAEVKRKYDPDELLQPQPQHPRRAPDRGRRRRAAAALAPAGRRGWRGRPQP